MEELELGHVVLLGSSLARTACGHVERKPHCSRAGVEQAAVLHAQSEYEWRGAEETGERARGRGCRGLEGIL